MSDETVVAAPSAAEETPATPEFDHSRGALVDLSPEQRSEYKKTGVLPKAPEPKADPAPAPKKETPSDTEPEADAGTKQQEHTEKAKSKPTAEERIAQLEATIEKIRKGAGLERKQESQPAPEEPKTQPNQPPQNYQEWRKTFKPTAWVEQYGKDNPEASYEDAQAAMSDFLDEVRGQFREAAERQRTGLAQMSARLDKAKARYGEKFDEVLTPTLVSLAKAIPQGSELYQTMEESDVLPDVLFVMGSEEGGAEKFLSMSAGQRMRWFVLNESLVRETLEAKAAPKAEPKADPPAKPQTSAPKPPSEVGGRAASPGDELESAAKANDYRRFSAESTRRALAAMKR